MENSAELWKRKANERREQRERRRHGERETDERVKTKRKLICFALQRVTLFCFQTKSNHNLSHCRCPRFVLEFVDVSVLFSPFLVQLSSPLLFVVKRQMLQTIKFFTSRFFQKKTNAIERNSRPYILFHPLTFKYVLIPYFCFFLCLRKKFTAFRVYGKFE